MCSITGVVYPKAGNSTIHEEIGQRVMATIYRAEDRGRDSWGYAMIFQNPQIPPSLKRWTSAPSQLSTVIPEMSHPGASVLINNNRAEPTTEYVKTKFLEDVQPYRSGGWYVVHNGTIANDKELKEGYGISVDTSIDSAVIPALLNTALSDDNFTAEDVARVLTQEVIGSYSLAIMHYKHPGKVILACNYKPLYLGYHPQSKYWMFSSQKEYITGKSIQRKLGCALTVEAIPPYSCVMVSNEMAPRDLEFLSLYPAKEGKPKALVVCSGGLDSTVVAAKAKKDGYDVTLLHFKYSCRAEEKEVIAIKKIAEYLSCEYMFVTTDIFKDVIKGSPLTGTGNEEIAYSQAGAEFAHEWVPARNLIMLSLATGIAESHGFDTLMLGNNLEESGAYPDNEMEFINKLNAVMPYSVAANKRVTIQMPVGNLMKHEIVKLGLKVDAPLHLTWSCYEAGKLHCGVCGPCYMRRTAFAINDTPEVINYEQ
jgi:7-cyano-7-deazaguanine synthase